MKARGGVAVESGWIALSRSAAVFFLPRLTRRCVPESTATGRRCIRLACLALAGALLAGCAKRELPPAEFSTRVDVGGADAPVIERELQPGTWLIEVREERIDVRVVVDAEQHHAELEDAVMRHGALFQVVDMRARGELRVEFRSADVQTKHGSATFAVRRLGTAAASHSDLVAGFRAFAHANELIAEKSPAAWTTAADEMAVATERLEAAGLPAEHALARYSLGCLQYLLREQWEPAVVAAKIAATGYRATNDEMGFHRASVLRASAELEIASNDSDESGRARQTRLYDAAERLLVDAADYFRRNSAPIDLQYAIELRGIRYLYVGERERAYDYFSESERLARANHDDVEIAKSLNNLAVIDLQRGYVARAAAEFEKTLPLVKREQADLYALILRNYGSCLIALGDFDRALTLHAEGMQVYAERGDEQMRARELSAIGGVYFRRGDFERALDALHSASAIQKRIGDGRGLASTLRVAGISAAELGKHAEALAYLRESRRFDADPQLSARTGVLIAAELRELGDLPSAQRELSAALSEPNPLTRASGLMERASQRLVRRDLESALEDLREADSVFRKLELDFNRIDSNTGMSKVLLEMGDAPAALDAANAAVEIANRIRTKSANPEWRAGFLSAGYGPYEAQVTALLAAAGPGDSSGLWKAFLAAEDIRAQSLSEHLSAGAAYGGAADEEDDALRSRLTAQQLSLENRLTRENPSAEKVLEAQRSIQETRAEMEANWVRRRTIHDHVSAVPKFERSLSEVRSALPPDTAVLAYFVGDSSSAAWLLTPRVLRHIRLPGRASLAEIVKQVTVGQRSGTSRPQESSSGVLLGNLLEGIGEGRLLILADGPLHGLPFAVLPLQQGTHSVMLVDRFVISLAPSLGLALRRAARADETSGQVAVISDPVYAANDRRLLLAAEPPSQPSAVSSRSAPLGRLPYSAIEARAVTRAFASSAVIALGGFDATSQRVLELSTRDLHVLHFATHALARPDAPEQSALFLSRFGSDGSALPNDRLTVETITRSGLHADLVVLSGCATGEGRELRGEGVIGLTYGFLANGSRNVVASLWPVEDAMTARFMQEFYAAYRASDNAAEALRSAQLRTRGSAASQVWSSFVIRTNGLR